MIASLKIFVAILAFGVANVLAQSSDILSELEAFPQCALVGIQAAVNGTSCAQAGLYVVEIFY